MPIPGVQETDKLAWVQAAKVDACDGSCVCMVLLHIACVYCIFSHAEHCCHALNEGSSDRSLNYDTIRYSVRLAVALRAVACRIKLHAPTRAAGARALQDYILHI